MRQKGKKEGNYFSFVLSENPRRIFLSSFQLDLKRKFGVVFGCSWVTNLGHGFHTRRRGVHNLFVAVVYVTTSLGSVEKANKKKKYTYLYLYIKIIY